MSRYLVLPQTWADFLDGGSSVAHSEAQASVVMNRRIRNRTSGGVGGRRGATPASYPIPESGIALSRFLAKGSWSVSRMAGGMPHGIFAAHCVARS